MALNSLMFQRCLSAIEAAKANPKLPEYEKGMLLCDCQLKCTWSRNYVSTKTRLVKIVLEGRRLGSGHEYEYFQRNAVVRWHCRKCSFESFEPMVKWQTTPSPCCGRPCGTWWRRQDVWEMIYICMIMSSAKKVNASVPTVPMAYDWWPLTSVHCLFDWWPVFYILWLSVHNSVVGRPFCRLLALGFCPSVPGVSNLDICAKHAHAWFKCMERDSNT